MVAVVVWHSLPPQKVGIFTMLFAVPLFFFTSGVFYKPSTDWKSLYAFAVKRVRGLYLPFVKWSLLFLALHNVLFHLNIYNDVYGFRGQVSTLYAWVDFGKKAVGAVCLMQTTEQLVGAFWFLRALFLASLLVAVVHFLLGKVTWLNRYIALGALAVGAWTSVHLNLSLPLIGNVGVILLSAAFYTAGYVLRGGY